MKRHQEQRLVEQVNVLCRGGLTAKELREQVLARVRPFVPFDAHVWLLTDPVTRVGTSPLATVPTPRDELPRVIQYRYLSRPGRWCDLMDAGQHVALLAEVTGGDLATSPMWSACLREHGVVDVASVALWDRYGCWAWLDLWRQAPAGPFTPKERQLLEQLAAPLTEALRQAQARTFEAHPEPLPMTGPAVVVLTPQLGLRTLTAWAADALFRLNPSDGPAPPIPAAVYNIAAALCAQEAGIPVGPPWSRVHLGEGRWVTLRADRMTPEDDATEAAPIVVTIETSTTAERREVFALAHGLSPRERQVLEELFGGGDTRAVARQLVLSEHTVNDHVRALLAKSRAVTRQELLTRIAGAA
jgi:DNA-binding CsgD family transcriptional regulator